MALELTKKLGFSNAIFSKGPVVCGDSMSAAIWFASIGIDVVSTGDYDGSRIVSTYYGGKTLHPGTYVVPEDVHMSEGLLPLPVWMTTEVAL